jgi:hypothetical protein
MKSADRDLQAPIKAMIWSDARGMKPKDLAGRDRHHGSGYRAIGAAAALASEVTFPNRRRCRLIEGAHAR